jgi:hypothetical protein
MSGSFLGIDVTTGPGGGLASTPPVSSGRATHFHAARLPELGDVVLAVTRTFDPSTGAALRLELRAFAAAAPGRGTLAELPTDTLLDAPGALAVAVVELSDAGDAADERRAARLHMCLVGDAAPTAASARGVADWLRTTWETELAFASWPAVRGTLDAFARDGGAVADWARDWLVQSEHAVEDGERASFIKVLSSAWLEDAAAAVDGSEAASGTK